MKKLQASACAAAVMLLAAPVQGQSLPGDWYFSVFGGGAHFMDYEFDFVPCCDYKLEMGNGYVVGAAVGASGLLGPNVRTEVELSHMRTNDFDAYSSPGGGFVGTMPTGSISSTNLLVNAWFDIPTGGSVMPYVGGGIGAGFAKGDLTITNGAGAQFNGSDTGLAYQAGFGASFPLGGTGYLDVGYRYRVVQDVEFDSQIAGFPTTAGDIKAHTVQIGARFEF